MDPVFRLATEADVAAEHRVFVRAEGGLLGGYGIPWPEPPLRWFDAIARHLLATDPARCHVAVVDGQVAGFSFAWVRDGVWFLAALFVDPDHHGQGIGGRLFDLAAAGAPSRQVTITDAIQPVSNALYARHGLVPTTPVLKFTGAPSVDAPAGLEAGAPGPGDLVELDRFGYGFERTGRSRVLVAPEPVHRLATRGQAGRLRVSLADGLHRPAGRAGRGGRGGGAERRAGAHEAGVRRDPGDRPAAPSWPAPAPDTELVVRVTRADPGACAG